MGTTGQQLTAFQNLTPADLKDPTLFRLNNDLSLLWNKLSAIYGSGGNVSLGANITVPMLYITGETQPPTNPQAALTLGAAEQLFSPNSTRTSLVFGTQSQPLPGGGGGTPSPTTAGMIIEAAAYCGGGGLTNSCINAAIAALPSTGGAIHCRTGTWNFTGPVNCNKANVIIFGDGYGTIFLRSGTMPASTGMFDITVAGVSIQTCQINGNVTSPVGLQYNTAPPNGFYVNSPETGSLVNYPLASTLTGDTSIWVHGGSHNFSMSGVMVTQTGGYAVLLDASTTTILNPYISDCLFTLNKPHLFGTSPGDLNYGAWTGGIFYIGGTYQAGAGTLSYVSNLTVCNNRFTSNNGTCVWGYSPQLYVLNQNISITGNKFQDCGLDGVNIGAAQTGVVDSNTFYRVGYINGTPKTLLAFNAVAIDTSGYVRGFTYSNNTIFQVNGEGIDLDGFTDGTVADNTIINADPSDYYYTVDQVNLYEYGTKGINSNSTFDLRGGKNVSITGNTIRNMNYNAIAVLNNRNSILSGNNIIHLPQALLGTVNTSGTAVTWVSGSKFPADIAGFGITINGTGYTIATVNSSTSLTLSGSAGTNTGVIFSIAGGLPVSLANNVLSGTVSTSGTAVTWVSGSKFDTNLDGTYTSGLFLDNGYLNITINGVQYQIASVGSATSLTLTATAGTQSGVAYAIGKLQNNTVTANQIYYNGVNICIFEDNSYGAVYGPNYIYNNKVIGAKNLGEVGLSTTTPNSSRTQLILSTNTPFNGGSPNPLSQSILQREGTGSSGTTKIYSTETGTSLFQLNDIGPILNISNQFASNTGALVTGARATMGSLVDYSYTGKTIVDGYSVFGMYNSNTSFYDTEMNSLDDSWGALRYERSGSVGTGGVFQISVSTSGGSRVWTNLGGGSSGVAGLDTQVQYNKSLSFGADGNFVWNYTTPGQNLTITGGTGASPYHALYVTDANTPHTAYIESDGGFLTGLAAINAIQAPSGGFSGRYLTLTTPTPSPSVQYPTAIFYITGSTVFGRLFSSVVSSDAGTMAMSANLSYSTVSSTWVADDSGANTAMIYLEPAGAANTPIIMYVGTGTGIGTPALQIYKNGNVGIQGSPTTTSGVSLTVTGTSGVATVAVAGGYVQSAQGFYSPYNSYATVNIPSGGGIFGLSVQLGPFNPGAPSTPSATFGGLAYNTGAKYWYYNSTAASWSLIDFSTSGGGAAGSDTYVQFNQTSSFGASNKLTFTYGATNPLLTVTGSSGQPVIATAGGYVQSAQGFYSTYNSAATLNVPSGGANVGLALQLGPLSSAPATPGSGFGGLAFNTGSTYWYWNDTLSAWNKLDFNTLPVPGSDKQIIFNNGGSLGASANFYWENTTQDMVIVGKTGAAAYGAIVVTDSNSPHTAYIQSDGGFLTALANTSAIQAPNGGVKALLGTFGGPNGQFPHPLLLIGTSGAGSSGSNRAPVLWQTSAALTLWEIGPDIAGTGGNDFYFNASGGGGGLAIGLHHATANVGLGTSAATTSGNRLSVAGSSGTWAIYASGGYIQSDQGFYSPYNSAATINVSSGGAWLGLALQLSPNSTSTPLTSMGTNGGFAYKSGSTYWYWTGSVWAQYNFAATAAVSSVTGSGSGISVSPTTGAVVVSNTGVTSLTAGTAISLSGGTGSVTVTNAGVTALTAGTGVTISASTGNVTVSIGQSVATAASPTFAAVTATGTMAAAEHYGTAATFNALAANGGLAVRTNAAGSGGSGVNVNDMTSNGVVVIDNNHAFVGSGGINTTGTATVAGVISSAGIQAPGYNVTGGFIGQTWTVNFAGGFTISASTFHNLIFRGGVLVSAS